MSATSVGSPDVDNIRKHYEHLLVKLMAGVQKELAVNKQPWLNAELKLIYKSLEGKLERKILHDVDNDLAQAMGSRTPVMEVEDSTNQTATQTPQSRLKGVVRNCLALVKYLQYEGDLEFTNNVFHLKIMEAIKDNFANKDDVVHAYSRSLIRIIQNEKINASKRLEMPA